MANSTKTESDHDHQDRVGACFGDHRFGQRSCVCQPAPRLAGGKQLPGGFGIRPNLGLGLRLNDESEHLPPHISTENDHEDACHKISGCTRPNWARRSAECRDSSFWQQRSPRPATEAEYALRRADHARLRAEGASTLTSLSECAPAKEPGDRALFFCVCDVPTVDQHMIDLTAPSPGPRCGRGAK